MPDEASAPNSRSAAQRREVRAWTLQGWGTFGTEALRCSRLVEARMGRQAVLTRDPPLRLWAITDEAALHRPVGGPGVMRAQLAHLAESAELPQVTLQALPYAVGAHPGMAGSFVILQ